MKLAFALASLSLSLASTAALAAPKPIAPIAAPAVGGTLGLTIDNAPKVEWLYDVPNPTDAAGKVIVHWFCAPKLTACADDLARLIALRDTGKVYIIAYVNGTKRDAQKLDPIRESEGVGKGTVGYGANAGVMMKQLGFAGPASIIVDAEGKVQQISTNGSADALDARDKEVNMLIGAIKDFHVAKNGPTTAKANQQFTISLQVSLASWLKYNNSLEPAAMKVTVPRDIKCDSVNITGDAMKMEGQNMTATAHCSAPAGSYEARAEIRFGYANSAGVVGIGTDFGDWSFTVTQ